MEIEPTIPFGKYKGQPITTLLKDTKYLEWCKQQEWFKKFPIIYNICVNQTIVDQAENSKTQEHNKIQNLFLEEENVKIFLTKVFNLKLKNLQIDCSPKYKIKFETQYNWDLFIKNCDYWYCRCDNSDCRCDNLVSRYTRKVYCEIKPLLGDDYPCVLRKMNTKIKLIVSSNEYSYNKFILLVKDFASSSTTKEQLTQIFQQSEIEVIFLRDVFKNDYTKIHEYKKEDEINELKEKVIKLEEENKMLKEKLKKYENN